MKDFTNLFIALDQTNKTLDKVRAIEQYFREALPVDAAWGLYFLSGGRLRGTVNTRAMREAVMDQTGVSKWMLDECYDSVGDLSETISLLLSNDEDPGSSEPLHEMVERRIVPLIGADGQRTRQMLIDTWRRLDDRQKFVFHKLVRGNFRLGVQRALVLRGLSAAIGVDAKLLAHRIAGGFEPTERAFKALSHTGTDAEASRPFPFCLAHQLDWPVEELGRVSDWQIEYKWDGIRAQILRRGGLSRGVAIWSRGEEPIEHQFPEIEAAARSLPLGTVLDGEILAWRFEATAGAPHGRPLSFNALQKRLNRKDAQPSLFDTEGVVFAAFDVLEHNGKDLRATPLHERRMRLEEVIEKAGGDMTLLRIPNLVVCDTWDEVHKARSSARSLHGAEGLMLKHNASIYHPGRTAGGTAESIKDDGGSSAGWWKWKVDPFSVDAVLLYAQLGSGKRAGLFTDYTFGIWDPDASGQLVAFAKAYSGLNDEEIRQVDRYVRANTLERKGPVRLVQPELVFEIAFESIRESPRHKAGVAVRFPRIARWRKDKLARDADTLGRVRSLMNEVNTRDAN